MAKQKIPTAEHAKIGKRYEAGETMQEIADTYDISRERIRQILAKIKVASRRRWGKHDAMIPAWIADYGEDRNPKPTVSGIARRYGVHSYIVRHSLQSAGVVIRSTDERVDESAPKMCNRCFDEYPAEEYRIIDKETGRREAHCLSCNAKHQNDYYYTDIGRASIEATRQRQEDKFPERRKAYTAVGHAVKDGRLPRISTQQCIYNCGRKAQQYHHYAGYAPENRLRVEPVCCKCHKRKVHNDSE